MCFSLGVVSSQLGFAPKGTRVINLIFRVGGSTSELFTCEESIKSETAQVFGGENTKKEQEKRKKMSETKGEIAKNTTNIKRKIEQVYNSSMIPYVCKFQTQ